MACLLPRYNCPAVQPNNRTLKVVEQVEEYYFTHEKDNIMSVFATVGSGPGGNGKTWRDVYPPERLERTRQWLTGTPFAIIERATKAFKQD
ncbi:hypothetical protein ACLK1S_15365 [Escherichia coli]